MSDVITTGVGATTCNQRELWAAFLKIERPYSKKKNSGTYAPEELQFEDYFADVDLDLESIGEARFCTVYDSLEMTADAAKGLAIDVKMVMDHFGEFMAEHLIEGAVGEPDEHGDTSRYRVPAVPPESRATVAA